MTEKLEIGLATRHIHITSMIERRIDQGSVIKLTVYLSSVNNLSQVGYVNQVECASSEASGIQLVDTSSLTENEGDFAGRQVHTSQDDLEGTGKTVSLLPH